MSEKSRAFNLLDEPWILARSKRGECVELSLTEVFRQAENLRALSCELPTLNATALRLLLSVLHAALGRGMEDADDALALWTRLWRDGLPVERITAYLERWRDRFWLFDEKRPFYQIAGLTVGTPYSAKKLLGTMAESNNKVRQFPLRTGETAARLSYAEAARWLLYLHAFDDASCKEKNKDREKDPQKEKGASCGSGWLGKCGFLCVEGKDLRKTLLLNFVLLDDNGEPWADGHAPWELETPRAGQRIQIDPPASQVELLTLQSRRIKLERDGGSVTGYLLLGGDFFPKENAFCEQMTLWRKDPKKDEYTPRRHSSEKQLWRDFMALTPTSARQPGVLRWLAKLDNEDVLAEGNVGISATSVKYDKKGSAVEDISADTLSVNAGLLGELGDAWRARIEMELGETDKAVKCVGALAAELAAAAGDAPDNKGADSKTMAGRREAARAEAYFRLDEPFRTWLSSIDPAKKNMGAMCAEWNETARNVLLALGNELAAKAGPKAFVGKEISRAGGSKGASNKEWMNTPAAFNRFIATIYKALPKEGGT